MRIIQRISLKLAMFKHIKDSHSNELKNIKNMHLNEPYNIKDKHSNDPSDWTCSKCQKVFKFGNTMRSHEKFCGQG